MANHVETTPHEVEGRWKWPDWGRGPYDALSSVMLGPAFEGYLELNVEIDGEPRRVRIEAILSELKASSFENVHTIAAEALEKWSKSGNDPSLLRRAQLTWRTPGGGTEVGYVGPVADR
ncbi:DUF7845 domain-containing protein [Natrarchaeobius oligotrophus]|uniref:DUF7845 domain-containing protein n=1 Tax=Natrarchaeobius chitinivorans TaxID=1679083 RepID=A0A3N6N670_NATCH|nr:hypothetical protein [Natrarchaeobius chitinivorans]RQH03427.1 hypothetical protein EA472_02365 [Natrarchaeobius chitinivorans]